MGSECVCVTFAELTFGWQITNSFFSTNYFQRQFMTGAISFETQTIKMKNCWNQKKKKKSE